MYLYGMARDKFHYEVKSALQEDGWKITDDPLVIKNGNIAVQIDMGAERLIGAEKDEEKIAVEIKTFGLVSFITAFYEAIGKYIVYRKALRMSKSDRELYLAIPVDIHEKHFSEALINGVCEEEQIKTIIYDQELKSITQWIEK
jgi:XisH protein